MELGYHSSKLCLLSLVWKNKLPENFILHKIFFFKSVVLIFLEGASRSPENCLADPVWEPLVYTLYHRSKRTLFRKTVLIVSVISRKINLNRTTWLKFCDGSFTIFTPIQY